MVPEVNCSLLISDFCLQGFQQVLVLGQKCNEKILLELALVLVKADKLKGRWTYPLFQTKSSIGEGFHRLESCSKSFVWFIDF